MPVLILHFSDKSLFTLMSALFLLIAVSLLIAGGFLFAFLWSIKDRQYEDQQGAAMRMLQDDPDEI